MSSICNTSILRVRAGVRPLDDPAITTDSAEGTYADNWKVV
jgi:hypothetical protein